MTTKTLAHYKNTIREKPNLLLDHYLGAMLAEHTIPTNNVIKFEYKRIFNNQPLTQKRHQNRQALVFAINQLQRIGRVANLDLLKLKAIPRSTSTKQKNTKKISPRITTGREKKNTFSPSMIRALNEFAPDTRHFRNAIRIAEGPLNAVAIAYAHTGLGPNRMRTFEESMRKRGFAQTMGNLPLRVQQLAYGAEGTRKRNRSPSNSKGSPSKRRGSPS